LIPSRIPKWGFGAISNNHPTLAITLNPQLHPWLIGCNALGRAHNALPGHWLAHDLEFSS